MLPENILILKLSELCIMEFKMKIRIGLCLWVILDIVMIPTVMDLIGLLLIGGWLEIGVTGYAFIVFFLSWNLVFLLKLRLRLIQKKEEKVNMAEKVKRSPLEFFPIWLKTLAFTVLILWVLLYAEYQYKMEVESSDGKAWCESVSHEYEEGPNEFLEKHSDSHAGQLFFTSRNGNKHGFAYFTPWPKGQYMCSYFHGVFFISDAYGYDSWTQEWRGRPRSRILQ